MISTIIIFIIVLGLLIFVHELGHFATAKRAGIRVDEFGFGLPPRIFGIKRGETIYSLNLLPIGGFVKIHGEERRGKEDKDKKRAFYTKPISTRAKILAAGVIMNVFLAYALLSMGHFIGLPQIVDDQSADLRDTKVQILEVAYDSPAKQAELKIGDTIKELGYGSEAIAVTKVQEVQDFIALRKGQEISMIITRGDEQFEKSVIARADYPEDQGPIGIALARTAIVSYPWYQSIIEGAKSTYNLTYAIVLAFGGLIWQLISTGSAPPEIAGPVGIFNLTGQAAQLGFIYLLQFTALLSINLAILNILPFPALDGGRLLFLLIEKIKGSPISLKIERYANLGGFAILMLLMIAITWRDVVRLF